MQESSRWQNLLCSSTPRRLHHGALGSLASNIMIVYEELSLSL